MKTININEQGGIKTFLYPDNQPHVNVADIKEGDKVKVICSITDSATLLQLLECADALDRRFAKKKVLVIPYLMGARSDRVMLDGDSVDLRVIGDLINSCKFKKVYLLDAHSDVSSLLIKRSVNISNKFLLDYYYKEDVVLICPDAGAVKKVDKYLQWNSRIKDVVYCNKVRNMSDGSIKLQVLDPDKCKGRNCLIVDDLCDGGFTFLHIASQIEPIHLTLIVTHGIFSKGLDKLEKEFNQIITSDSYPSNKESSVVTVISHNL